MSFLNGENTAIWHNINMEHLTKQQVILLALLVSFVSSIASGIVTVSLLDQAPPAVTQTINHVVEKTIERVSPSGDTQGSTKETIVIKDDQAVVLAIDKASKSIAHIQNGGFIVGLGLIVSSSGKVIGVIDSSHRNNLSLLLSGGNVVALSFVSEDPLSGISLFQAEQSVNPKDARVYNAATFANSDDLKLGDAVVSIFGGENIAVAAGIISSFSKDRIMTDAHGSDPLSHAILINLSGNIVGVRDSTEPLNTFIPSNIIKTYATP